MEEEVISLGSSLVLMEEEEMGVVMPAGVWHSDPEKAGFYAVGCLLSHKPYNAEAFKTVLRSSFNPAKGMEITFLEHDRFLLKFFHFVDRDRVLESGPWAFEKSLLVLAAFSDNDNPAEVDLGVTFTFEFTACRLGRLLKLRVSLQRKLVVLRTVIHLKGHYHGGPSCAFV
ncbi:UNVERIFIED_CONTAM: hypothetical protein Sangu_1697700 [Sesamum angustifolium]|uniref:DUF4283 domain-containing protein n=1 Tax=Sesamum angustifolium TaxID=2727405 RepID=A0AAW2MJS8_9LAMI